MISDLGPAADLKENRATSNFGCTQKLRYGRVIFEKTINKMKIWLFKTFPHKFFRKLQMESQTKKRLVEYADKKGGG